MHTVPQVALGYVAATEWSADTAGLVDHALKANPTVSMRQVVVADIGDVPAILALAVRFHRRTLDAVDTVAECLQVFVGDSFHFHFPYIYAGLIRASLPVKPTGKPIRACR